MPKFLLRNGLAYLGFLPGSIVIKANPLTMRSFLTSVKCTVCGNQQPCHTIHMATRSAKDLIGLSFGLMRTLTSEQKPNWPVYLPPLVYAYNATLHSSTGFQPYKLVFGHKASMPCDNWLGLDNYKPESFKSKTIWLNQQLNAMLHANKKALKLIEKSTKCNKDCTGSKELTILIRNHVLLHDHPEGHNKIQVRYKSDIYIIMAHHKEPNVYYIQLLDKSEPGPQKVVN